MILLNNLLKRAAVQWEYDAWLLVPEQWRSEGVGRPGAKCTNGAPPPPPSQAQDHSPPRVWPNPNTGGGGGGGGGRGGGVWPNPTTSPCVYGYMDTEGGGGGGGGGGPLAFGQVRGRSKI